MYIQSLFRSDDIKSEQADMTNSNMSLVCLSRSSDITVNLDSVFAEGVAAIIPSQSDETATLDYWCQELTETSKGVSPQSAALTGRHQ